MLTLLLLACAAHSPRGASAPAATAAGFRYDAASGRCLDAEGREGRNTVAIEEVRATRDAQCADLRGVQLLTPSTGDLEGWDLRGADLTGATLHFSALLDADLRGADLAGFEFGYVQIRGVVDEHTRLPPACVPSEGVVECAR